MNLGCYNDKSSARSSKPLPDLLFDDQANIDLENWDEFLDDLVAKCAERARDLNYTHFGIQSLAQCYSGPNAADTYNKYETSENCVTVAGNPRKNQFQRCSGVGKPCTGGDNTNYVYKLVDSELSIQDLSFLLL